MKEQEYINATNRVKVTAAKNILRDVLIIDGNGIDETEYKILMRMLIDMEEELFKTFNVV